MAGNLYKQTYFEYQSNNGKSNAEFQQGHLTPNADFSQAAERVNMYKYVLFC